MLEDLTGCPHITTQIRAVSVHSGMQVGARVSPTGNLWWCVGCGILFEDEQAKRPLAIPSQTAPPIFVYQTFTFCFSSSSLT